MKIKKPLLKLLFLLFLASEYTESYSQNFWQPTNGPQGGIYRDITCNPTTGQIYFSELQNEIEIYNFSGQIVVPKIRNIKNISVEQLGDGIYFIRTDKAIMKFIVKH